MDAVIKNILLVDLRSKPLEPKTNMLKKELFFYLSFLSPCMVEREAFCSSHFGRKYQAAL